MVAGMTMSSGAVIQAGSYSSYTLRKGDSDAAQKWTGGKKSAPGGDPVRQAQIDLKVGGCYDGNPDGKFGNGTATAVRRFQWNLRNVDRCLKRRNGSILQRSVLRSVTVSGQIDAPTAAALRTWGGNGWGTTGTLRLAALSKYSDIVRGTLKALSHPSVTSSTMAVHKDFLKSLTSIDKAATKAGIKLKINQAFRVAGVPVRGAVVKPATKSQHLIGNAIDWNIENGGKVILSAKMDYSKLPSNVKGFIDDVKKAGVRWGGDFKSKDPIHFDAYVNPKSDSFDMLYFFNQRSIQNKHPI
jgi:peptidoglycan hydrolase-like protein with peptidoglycan-binding domain